MCVVSNVGDYWRNSNPWIDKIPSTNPYPNSNEIADYFKYVSKAEFDKLKKEVEELRKLLEAAKKYDEATGQPHCEVEDKVGIIKAVAQALGVDLKDVLD